MAQSDTAGVNRRSGCILAVAVSLAATSLAQPVRPDWRRTGNSSLLIGLAGPASGPAVRVWFLPGSGGLAVLTASGRVFATSDFSQWTASAEVVPPAVEAEAVRTPSGARALRAETIRAATVYAFGDSLWRSEDNGIHWQDVARFRGENLLGEQVADVAVAPGDARRVALATPRGVWLSLDGGQSWESLNEGLPNLPARRLLGAPRHGRGLRIAASSGETFEWLPGQKLGWTRTTDSPLQAEAALRQQLTAQFGVSVTAVAVSAGFIYAGSADGRLFASQDRGRSWRVNPPEPSGWPEVETVWVDPSDPRTALAGYALGSEPSPRLVRTINAGAFWDDLTATLPAAAVRGISADPATGAIYAATGRGVFWTLGDLRAPAAATSWVLLSPGWPEAPVVDVRLDDGAHQLYAAVEGYGVYATAAPHRPRLPVLVHTADYESRPAAPGALLSLLGARTRSVQAGDAAAPVLAASDSESQIQVPFEVRGEAVDFVFRAGAEPLRLRLPLRAASPSILVDREGTPMLLDADTGVQVDALNPVRPGMRLQILCTGLGRVSPDWPTGLPAPLENPPAVVAPLLLRIDGQPLEVVRATLAPGYIGFYLVEARLPELLDAGAATLEIEASGQPGNRVRLYAARD